VGELEGDITMDRTHPDITVTNEGIVPELRAEIDRLRAEVEQMHVQLANCGVTAICNTHQSRENQKCVEGDYGWSQSYQDVIEAVGREIALREESRRLRAELKTAHTSGIREGMERALKAAKKDECVDDVCCCEAIIKSIRKAMEEL
jgi:uncharacterized small protein (DUF1192 family)